MPQTSWSPSTTQQLRKLVAAPYLPPNDWTPRLDAYFASPLALCARRVSSAASRLLGTTSLRFALHGWQRAVGFGRHAILYRQREQRYFFGWHFAFLAGRHELSDLSRVPRAICGHAGLKK
ncbi:hypothetical protein [Thiolapillus sp.]|uniref:hypothetical protein n=2 Tax=Thiolapillus sp. TaxID=2017437 RepID=UPI0025D035D1|nr:hypothetical protein [Thiolapillus sp.]